MGSAEVSCGLGECGRESSKEFGGVPVTQLEPNTSWAWGGGGRRHSSAECFTLGLVGTGSCASAEKKVLGSRRR